VLRRCGADHFREPPERGRALVGSAGVADIVVGHEGGGHHPAVIVFFLQIPIEPGATGASLRDKDEVVGFRWPLADEWINVTLTCPKGAQGGHCGAMILGDIRHSNGILVDIHADEECARLQHG
jgi:hypothetical protein